MIKESLNSEKAPSKEVLVSFRTKVVGLFSEAGKLAQLVVKEFQNH